ncbi:MAG: ornithine cyclodeaminase, partial [Rubrivivax sp.]
AARHLADVGVSAQTRTILSDGVRPHRCAHAAEARKGADIVTTVTADKRNATVLTPSMVSAGMHINAVGGDCPGKTELHADILRRPDARVVVEFEPQSRIEGEVQQIPADFPVLEFADVVRGQVAGRTHAGELMIFDSVGFALEDYSTLCLLHRMLREQPGVGRRIGLIPTLDDPKDLFGGTLLGHRRLRRAA